MARAIKIFLIVIAALVVLLAATVFVVTQVIDPNDFKPQIREQAMTQANLDLEIPGDLAWQFWPSLGVSLGRTEARIAGEEDLFAGINSASVGVAVWPLLFGQVEMDGVTLDGLEVNLVETADGANWEKIGPQDGAEEETAPTEEEQPGESGGMDIPLTIPSVAITDGKIRYRNTTDGTDIRVEHFNFNAQDVSLEEPFPMQMSLRYQDQSDMRVDLNLGTTLAADLENNHFVLDPMTLDADIAGMTTNPVSVHLEQKLDVNLDEDRAQVTDLLLEAAGTRTTGNATVTGLTGEMKVAGQINTEPFDANKALEAIGEEPIATRDDNALSKVALSATLDGPANSVMVNPLKVTLDSSTLTGTAGLENLESGKIVFDLNLDKITLDGYLPPQSDEQDSGAASGAGGGTGGKEGGTTQLSEAELIPVDSLRPLLLDGSLKIGELNYDTIQASNIVFNVDAKDGVLRLTKASGDTLQGGFNASGRLDVSGNTPRISFKQNVSSMQLQPVVAMALDKDLAKGIFSMDLDFSASGNSEKALVNSAKGNASMNLADGTVRGLNLYGTLVGGVNDMLGRFQGLSALIPNQESGKLPAALSEDTKIIDLTTKASLNQQVANLDSLEAKLDKGTLSGNGWMNMLTQEFDLKIGMQSPELGGSKYLEDVTWPLRCQGSLAGSPAKWCGPDKEGFAKIAQQAATNAAKGKLKEKLGIDAEGDTTEEVMKNAAKKKAQEKIEEEMGDKLKGFFNR
ncbi:MAG TPA: AsmA family protein [Alcanivorax sp.]|nr:AsmA family protein [Alcanivorax sp.]MBT74949.1 AsmA family protein [Alcanivorax sp.]HBP92163.1 AsmA family protein [Alcanivorax sp.]|tara:strand:- start:5526 stop:7751 length:2226 start_codon:yes stop_codon:yes gene_type:complete